MEYNLKLIKELGVNKGTRLDGLPARFIEDGAMALYSVDTYYTL